MKLQMAMDSAYTFDEALSLCESVRENVDIFEVGTPLLMYSGLELVHEIKEQFPEKMVLADLKIADAGKMEASMAFAQGADIATALAAVDDVTIENALLAARKFHKELMVDMLAVTDSEKRVHEIDSMGVGYICFHTGKDLQKIDTDADQAFRSLRGSVKHARLALAGGIGCGNIARYVAIQPDIIIVGEGITAAENPNEAAKLIKEKMNEGIQEGMRCCP